MRECCQQPANRVYVMEPDGEQYALCVVCGAKHYTADLPAVRYQTLVAATGRQVI